MYPITVPGAISSELERYDSHSDNVDRGSLEVPPAVIHSSERASHKQGSVLNRGKKRELLIDDVVGSASSRMTSALDSSVLDVKGKSERDRDQKRDNMRNNSLSGGGFSSMDSIQTERKTKAKSKQKITLLSPSGSGLHGQNTDAAEPYRESNRSAVNAGQKKGKSMIPRDSLKEEEPVDLSNLKHNEFDSMEEIEVPSHDLDEHHDFGSWLNFDEDGLQDHDSIGLEIPMDDLSDLNMLM